MEYEKVKRRQAPDHMSGRTRDAYGKYEFNVSPTIRYHAPLVPRNSFLSIVVTVARDLRNREA